MSNMTRREALRLAIAALQREYRRWLFASDSEASDERRAEIAAAVEVLDNLRRQKELW